MKIQKIVFAALLAILSTTGMIAQDTEKDSHTLSIAIPEVALLDIESEKGSNAIALNATAPTEAGEKVTFNQTNSDLWLNYSSIVGNNSSRGVDVQITDGNVPSGIDLTVAVDPYQGDGEGSMGFVISEPQVLNGGNSSNLIMGIGSAYTGNGATKGHRITYKIQQNKDTDAYSKLNFEESTDLTITYTLTDN